MSRRTVAIAALGLWLGCSGKLLTIKVSQSAQTTVGQGSLIENLVGDLGFDGFLDMDLMSSAELANQGVQPGDVQDVRLTLFELEALEPDGADLSFLESVELWVEAPDLEAVLVASADTFGEGETIVAFDLEDVDLTEYVVSESMTLTTEVSGHRPEDDTVVEARFEIAVGVTAQGACNNL